MRTSTRTSLIAIACGITSAIGGYLSTRPRQENSESKSNTLVTQIESINYTFSVQPLSALPNQNTNPTPFIYLTIPSSILGLGALSRYISTRNYET